MKRRNLPYRYRLFFRPKEVARYLRGPKKKPDISDTLKREVTRYLRHLKREVSKHSRHPKKVYAHISNTLKKGSREVRHPLKHKKTTTVRDNDGMRCEAAAVRGSFSSVGAKHIKCNNIIIYIKTPPTVERLIV